MKKMAFNHIPKEHAAKGGSDNKNNRLLRFARNDVNNLSTYPLINLSTYKRKDCTTMTKNENVKKILEAGVLTKRHSEDEVRRIPYLLNRFFAKYQFPFAGSCVRPTQNDGKFLVPQCLSNLVSYCPLSLPSPSGGEGCKTVKNLFTYLPIHLFTLKKIAAFTLAEVLITLGIIGVVAAITIPNLIFNYRTHVTINKLKETYSILTQAIKMAEEEYGEADGWGITGRDASSAKIVAAKLMPFLKNVQNCGTSTEQKKKCSGKYDTCYNLDGTIDGDCAMTNNNIRTNLVFLNNGAMVTFDGGDVDNEQIFYIQTDINGAAKPNKWGYDVFEFTYYQGKGLLPSGNPQTTSSYKNYCSNTRSKGYGCAYYVLMFGNMDYLKK